MEKIQQLEINKLYIVKGTICRLIMSKFARRGFKHGYRPILKQLTQKELFKLYNNNLKGGAKKCKNH